METRSSAELYLQYVPKNAEVERDTEDNVLLSVPLSTLVTVCALKRAKIDVFSTQASSNQLQTSSPKIKFVPIQNERKEKEAKIESHEYLIRLPCSSVVSGSDSEPISVSAGQHIFILRQLTEPQVSACSFPAVFVPEENRCITGLCSVIRYIITNFAPQESLPLLGHQANCLSAPAEASTWTKFCEIDLPLATESFLFENSEHIPDALTKFEIHLRQPVKIHNIRKKMQQLQPSDSSNYEIESNGRQIAFDANGIKVDPIILFAQSQHLYAEGPEYLLSDAIIYPHYYLIMKFISDKEGLIKLLPKSFEWFKRVSKERDFDMPIIFDKRCDNILISDWKISADLPEQSLYKSDPKRLNPNSRIFTRQPDIDRAMDSVSEADIGVLTAQPFDYSTAKPEGLKIDWDALPPLVHPLGGQLPPSRLEKKCQQLENLASAVIGMAKPGDVIVDFCSGGGHLAILLAYLLPSTTVYLVENKEQSLMRAVKRVQALKMKNCRFYQGNMDYFNGYFDIGVSLHACGVATDLVIQACIRKKASFVSCPCCYGSVQANHMLSYPRSKRYSSIAFKDYLVLGHTADQTHGTNDKEVQGRLAMNIIDTDRIQQALESGLYATVELHQLHPPSCTPKNNLIIGRKFVSAKA